MKTKNEILTPSVATLDPSRIARLFMPQVEFSKSMPRYPFSPLPEEWTWVREQLVDASGEQNVAKMYGLAPDSESILLFHGTQRDKARVIASEGMKPFEEKPYVPPKIFVTASPTMALFHATDRGPHDTLRKKGETDYQHKPEEARLLSIRIPKDWLVKQPEVSLPINTPKWLKENKGITPENDSRLFAFMSVYADEVATIQAGVEVSDFGIVFPVSHIPAQFIRTIEPSDHRNIF